MISLASGAHRSKHGERLAKARWRMPGSSPGSGSWDTPTQQLEKDMQVALIIVVAAATTGAPQPQAGTSAFAPDEEIQHLPSDLQVQL